MKKKKRKKKKHKYKKGNQQYRKKIMKKHTIRITQPKGSRSRAGRKPTQKVLLEAHRDGDVRKDMVANVEEIGGAHKTNWRVRV
jgi:hypothetical protein